MIRRSWWIVLISTVLGLLAGLGAYTMLPKTYTSQTELFVTTRSAGTMAELQQGEVFAQSRAQSYVAVASSTLVLDRVVKELGLTESAGMLAQRMTAVVKPGTVVIQISVYAPKPQDAEVLAQSINSSLRDVAASLENLDDIKTSPVELLTITNYTPVTSPSSPNRSINMALGSIMGMLSGLGISVIRQGRRDKNRAASLVNDCADVEEEKWPVVAGSRKAHRIGGKK